MCSLVWKVLTLFNQQSLTLGEKQRDTETHKERDGDSDFIAHFVHITHFPFLNITTELPFLNMTAKVGSWLLVTGQNIIIYSNLSIVFIHKTHTIYRTHIQL